MKITPEEIEKLQALSAEILRMYQDSSEAEEFKLAEAIPALIADLEDVQRELENERARGIHSCHDNCTRDGCVNRRLREELADVRKQLAEAQALLVSGADLLGKVAMNAVDDFVCASGQKYADLMRQADTPALDAAIAEAIEPYRKDAACWQFARKELCWREEGKKQIRWTMILRMPKPNIGIEVLSEGSVAKELDAAVLAAIAANGETE